MSQGWDKPPLLFSHVEHPQIELIKPLLKQAYNSLQIPIEFVAIPPERELRAVERGEVDGITARTGFIESGLSHTFRVPVSLLDVNIYLICRIGVVCDPQMLNEPLVSVAVPSGDSIARLILKDRKALALELTSNDQLIELTGLGRIDFALFAVVASREELLADYRVQVAQPKILQTGVYHYLNERHRHLIPAVEPALQKALRDASLIGSAGTTQDPSPDSWRYEPAR
ncbi:hypothetical protein GCM10027098_24150 [Bowmanella dokdonensis]